MYWLKHIVFPQGIHSGEHRNGSHFNDVLISLSLKFSCLIVFQLAFCFPVYVTKDELKPLLFQCPSKTEWRFRAKWYCNANGGFSEENYACLYNEIKNISTEACNIKPHILEKGLYFFSKA